MLRVWGYMNFRVIGFVWTVTLHSSARQFQSQTGFLCLLTFLYLQWNIVYGRLYLLPLHPFFYCRLCLYCAWDELVRILYSFTSRVLVISDFLITYVGIFTGYQIKSIIDIVSHVLIKTFYVDILLYIIHFQYHWALIAMSVQNCIQVSSLQA